MNDEVMHSAKFRVGQLIRHKMFGYRGAIFDVDPCFKGSEEWYSYMAKSKPPKDRPWYHVLVHDASHTTYVAERNLECENDPKPIENPAINQVFTEFKNGEYLINKTFN